MGVPRPAYGGGGYASPGPEASQDWHKRLKSIPDEKYIPEGVNLAQKRSNLARG
jgi:hypothetical protein